MTPAQAAYEADLKLRPHYHDGSPRKTWAQLDPLTRATWVPKAGREPAGHPSTIGAKAMNTCPHCGILHQTTCPRIKAIEYNADGTVRRIELHAPQAPVPMTLTDSVRIVGVSTNGVQVWTDHDAAAGSATKGNRSQK